MSLFRNRVYIQPSQADKNYSLCIEHDDKETCSLFLEYACDELPRDVRWFVQSNCDNFKMIEFWFEWESPFNRKSVESILGIAKRVAKRLGLAFEEVC